MRRAMLAGAAVLALGGPAMAGDLDFTLEDFGPRFNAVAAPLHPGLSLAAPMCAARDHCVLDAGDDVVVSLTAAPAGDPVESVLVGSELRTEAEADRFAQTADALVALLSPGLDRTARGKLLSALVAVAATSAEPPSSAAGGRRYTMRKLSSGALSLTAELQ